MPRTIAHLDLKGLQQRPAILLDRLDEFARLGYQAILVEYEDVFPYGTEKFSDRPGHVWSLDFHREFLERARTTGLEIIPLQQTLGHLEYALRWDKLADFRLCHDDPTTLDLTSSDAVVWILGLLGEMMDAHPDSRHIHLGMDEARPLAGFARQAERDPLGMFLDHLERLLDFCEARGKTPILWSDMLEDHLRPENLPKIRALRERVILACWDYAATARPETTVRFAGRRVSRHWLEHPEAGGGPRLTSDAEWIEDWPPEIQNLVAPYRVTESSFQSLCPAALWKGLGFRVWGAAAASPSEDGPLIPLYHRRMENLDRWREAVREWQLDGLIVTAWARSQTCSPPGILPDLQMPMFRYALQGDFEETRQGPSDGNGLRNLFLRLGRCRESWWIESDLIQELECLAPSSTDFDPSTRRLLITLLRIQAVRRQLDLATYQAERFLCGDRMPTAAWEARLEKLQAACDRLLELRAETQTLLEERHFGEALEEWMSLVFSDPLEAAKALIQKITLKKSRAAKRFR